MDYRAGKPRVVSGQREKIFLFFHRVHPGSGPTKPPVQRTTGPLSQEVKRPGREADQLCPPSAELKTGGAIPTLPNKYTWRCDYLTEHRNKLFHFVYSFHSPVSAVRDVGNRTSWRSKSVAHSTTDHTRCCLIQNSSEMSE